MDPVVRRQTVWGQTPSWKAGGGLGRIDANSQSTVVPITNSDTRDAFNASYSM